MKVRADLELSIIRRILEMLEPLPASAKGRVLDYVIHRLDADLETAKLAEGEPVPLLAFPDRETRRAERAS
jgi:hypothetical protein